MKDRTPTYPGRVRLIPVAGQSDVYDLQMADEPTEEGTPPTKATLLSDATAAATGGSDTVNEAIYYNAMVCADLEIRKKEFSTFELIQRGLI